MAAWKAMTAEILPDVAWHISTRSDAGSGNCVEAGPILDGSGRVAVRHSQHRQGHVLVYDKADWGSLIAGVRSGCFDRLSEVRQAN